MINRVYIFVFLFLNSFLRVKINQQKNDDFNIGLNLGNSYMAVQKQVVVFKVMS